LFSWPSMPEPGHTAIHLLELRNRAVGIEELAPRRLGNSEKM